MSQATKYSRETVPLVQEMRWAQELQSTDGKKKEVNLNCDKHSNRKVEKNDI